MLPNDMVNVIGQGLGLKGKFNYIFQIENFKFPWNIDILWNILAEYWWVPRNIGGGGNYK